MTAREVLDGIKDRLTAATPGPWEFDGAEITTVPDYESDNPTPWKAVMDCEVSCGSYCYGGSVAMSIGDDDRAFIAAAPVDVARLTRAVEAVLELHTFAHTDVEPWAIGYRFGGDHCAFDGQPYPCPTVAAIEKALNP